MPTLLIIPARGGSKRIKRKNLKVLCGKPLIDYTIDLGKSSGIEHIIVSSEDKDILEHAKSKNILIHNRPKNLAEENNKNELEQTKLLVLNYVSNELNINFNKYLFLLPTYPFRSEKDIKNAIMELDNHNFICSIEQLNTSHYSNFKNNYIEPLNYPIIKRNSFLSGGRKNREDNLKKYFFYKVNKINNIDIDTELDWIQAEYVINNNMFNFQTGEIKGDHYGI